MLVIVPNIVHDQINEALDQAFIECPEAKKERDALYNQLLAYFNEHGVIPSFSLRKV